jgi:hypothetical protein
MTKNQSNVQAICSALFHTAINQNEGSGSEVEEMNSAVKEITDTISMLTLGENMRDGMLTAIHENSLTDNIMLSMTLVIKTHSQTGFNALESDVLDGIVAATRELRSGIDTAVGQNAFKKVVLAAANG